MVPKLIENIDTSYVERVYDDILTFLKNVNRLKNYNDYFELLEYWDYWIENEFTKFAKKVGGVELSGYEDYKKFSDAGKQIIRIVKSMGNLFSIDENDFDKARKKVDIGINMNEFWADITAKLNVSIVPWDIANYIKNNSVQLKSKLDTSEIEILKDYYFQLWKSNSNSRYISTKKIVDEVFNFLLHNKYYDDESGNQMLGSIEDKYIENYTEYNGVRIGLIYNEIHESELMDKLGYVKSVINIAKKLSIAFILDDMNLTIDLVNNYNNYEFILSNKSKTKNGGLYRINNKEIVISSNAYGEDIITILLHEIGHKYYYEVMNSGQRKEWEQYYKLLVDGGSVIFDEFQDLVDSIGDFFGKLYDERRKARDEYYDTKKIPSSWTNFGGKITKNIDSVLTYIYDEYIDKDSNYSNIKKFLDKDGMIDEYYSYVNKETKKDLKKNGDSLLDEDFNTLTSTALSTILDNLYNFPKEYYRKDRSNLPSDYAGENERELFAETFASILVRKSNVPNVRGFYYNEDIMDQLRIISGLRESYNNDKYILIENHILDITKILIENENKYKVIYPYKQKINFNKFKHIQGFLYHPDKKVLVVFNSSDLDFHAVIWKEAGFNAKDFDDCIRGMFVGPNKHDIFGFIDFLYEIHDITYDSAYETLRMFIHIGANKDTEVIGFLTNEKQLLGQLITI